MMKKWITHKKRNHLPCQEAYLSFATYPFFTFTMDTTNGFEKDCLPNLPHQDKDVTKQSDIIDEQGGVATECSYINANHSPNYS